MISLFMEGLLCSLHHPRLGGLELSKNATQGGVYQGGPCSGLGLVVRTEQRKGSRGREVWVYFFFNFINEHGVGWGNIWV